MCQFLSHALFCSRLSAWRDRRAAAKALTAAGNAPAYQLPDTAVDLLIGAHPLRPPHMQHVLPVKQVLQNRDWSLDRAPPLQQV